MKATLANCLLFCVFFSSSSAQSQTGTLTIVADQLNQAVHVGDTVRLQVTIANLSKEAVTLAEPHGGGWLTEVYDSADSDAEDLAAPLKRNNGTDFGGDSPVKVMPGDSLKSVTLIVISPEIYSHSGTYQVNLVKREWHTHVVFRSNPVTINVIPR